MCIQLATKKEELVTGSNKQKFTLKEELVTGSDKQKFTHTVSGQYYTSNKAATYNPHPMFLLP